MHTVIELSIEQPAPQAPPSRSLCRRTAFKLAKCVDCVWPVRSAGYRVEEPFHDIWAWAVTPLLPSRLPGLLHDAFSSSEASNIAITNGN